MTTEAIKCAKLQSNRHHQQTNSQLFRDLMPFLSANQQWCQSTDISCTHMWQSYALSHDKIMHNYLSNWLNRSWQ